MSGVYGNMLDSFPELFRHTRFWKQDPIVGAGFGPEYDINFYDVIIIDDTGDRMVRQKIRDFILLDSDNNDVLYTNDDTPVEMGMFLVHPDNNQVHRIVKALDHNYTGGYCVWGIQKVQGDNGSMRKELTLNEGDF
jgi:hypothetical protein